MSNGFLSAIVLIVVFLFADALIGPAFAIPLVIILGISVAIWLNRNGGSWKIETGNAGAGTAIFAFVLLAMLASPFVFVVAEIYGIEIAVIGFGAFIVTATLFWYLRRIATALEDSNRRKRDDERKH
jgi:hypothetical protein